MMIHCDPTNDLRETIKEFDMVYFAQNRENNLPLVYHLLRIYALDSDN